MSPKQKAKELFDKFYYIVPSYELPIDDQVAKECALIAVHEILQINWIHSQPECFDDLANEYKEKSFYWNEVKKEIEKL